MIEIKHLSKTFQMKDGAVNALKDIDLTIPDGSIYGIIGMSGAGKSTLVRCINLLERPTEGSVVIDGTAMETLSPAALRERRRDITMIFQQFNLLMQRTCLQNVCFPMELSGVKKADADRRAKELLEQGVIGDVITFRTGLGTSGPEGWSMEGNWFFDKKKAVMGALSDLGIHKVDLLQYLTGQKVIETTAKVMTLNKHTATGAPITVDDNALCILRMSGGAVGTLAASWTVYGHECQSTCLYGTKGIMLIYNNNNPAAPIEVRNLDGTSTTYNIPPETNSGVIDEFVAALEQNREPEVSGREALSTMRAIFGSIKSSEIGRTVSVNDSYVNHL